MDPESPESDLTAIIRKFTLQNALFYKGTANAKAVIGKLMAECPEVRARVKEIMSEVDRIVAEVNSMNTGAIETELERLAPELVHKEKHAKELVLPDLANIENVSKVIMRFAPGPSGPLHIGHSRALILNDEYVKRYNGKLIIRLEDTNPQNIEPTAYDMIPEDLSWLGVTYHELLKQSDRFDIYYTWAEELLKLGHAYICTCPVETWRELKSNGSPCPDRALTPSENLERWQKLLAREYAPGAASFIVKTDLNHPNPAVRDFVGLRMVSEPHPVTGDKYYVYPTYNFSVAVDDHLMGITHILRGKDHLNNTHRQKYIYNYLSWPVPEFIHYGWVSLDEVVLKTTAIKDGIRTGKFSGWSDIQLGTLQALAQRGIQPDAIRRYWLDVGIKDVDITFSWQTLYSFNKDLVDKIANRYFFVWSPHLLVITGVDEVTGIAPLHPNDPERGMRETKLAASKLSAGEGPNAGAGTDAGEGEGLGIELLIPMSDLAGLKVGDRLRLKDLCNIELTQVAEGQSVGRFIGNDLSILKEGVKIIHWVADNKKLPISIHLPNGKIESGFCEPPVLQSLGQLVQFERFGFVKLASTAEPEVVGWFSHK